jgi:MinD superfamily P-loop ATPase
MVVDNMKIAVLSGKGGTGKTLLSVNLASVYENSNYVDCDVEEPNGHLFFKPNILDTKDINVKVPVIDHEKCIGCKKCVKFCKFNALAYAKKVLVFEDICHSCGACLFVCPQNAIYEKDRVIGKIDIGHSEDVNVFTGTLNIGESSGTPIISNLLKEFEKDNKLTIIDAPPGSACIVMDTIKDVDYCVLVAEPTEFGSHNLNIVYELVKLFKKPFGVVLNKTLDKENPSENFCISKGIKILGKIPYDKNLGDLNSNSLIAAREDNFYRNKFKNILKAITKEAKL